MIGTNPNLPYVNPPAQPRCDGESACCRWETTPIDWVCTNREYYRDQRHLYRPQGPANPSEWVIHID